MYLDGPLTSRNHPRPLCEYDRRVRNGQQDTERCSGTTQSRVPRAKSVFDRLAGSLSKSCDECHIDESSRERTGWKCKVSSVSDRVWQNSWSYLECHPGCRRIPQETNMFPDTILGIRWSGLFSIGQSSRRWCCRYVLQWCFRGQSPWATKMSGGSDAPVCTLK